MRLCELCVGVCVGCVFVGCVGPAYLVVLAMGNERLNANRRKQRLTVSNASIRRRFGSANLFDHNRIDMNFDEKLTFLDAATHLYKRLCPSVGRSVGPSVGHAFLKNCKFK